jgi:hypothetical protein
MPYLLKDAKEWGPSGYKKHIQENTFSNQKLAGEDNTHVPNKFRAPLEQTISQIHKLIATAFNDI